MITPEDMLAMLVDRARDPDRACSEAVMLRASFDRLDDWCVWVEQHVADDHAEDSCAQAISETVRAMRTHIARELRVIDASLAEGDQVR
jgi:hypothetical protein